VYFDIITTSKQNNEKEKIMTNFEKQLQQAIKTYSEFDGRTYAEIKNECASNPNGVVAENIKMLMFAAR
jgi:hypothetical protein